MQDVTVQFKVQHRYSAASYTGLGQALAARGVHVKVRSKSYFPRRHSSTVMTLTGPADLLSTVHYELQKNGIAIT